MCMKQGYLFVQTDVWLIIIITMPESIHFVLFGQQVALLERFPAGSQMTDSNIMHDFQQQRSATILNT